MKLWGVANMLEGRDIVQRDPDRLERCLCEPHQVQQGWVQGPAPRLEQSLAPIETGRRMIKMNPRNKDWGVFVDEKLNVTHQCALAAWLSQQWHDWWRWFCHSTLSFWNSTWSTSSSSGGLQRRNTWIYWNESRGVPLSWSEDWNTSHLLIRQGEEWGLLNLGKRRVHRALYHLPVTKRISQEGWRGTFYSGISEKDNERMAFSWRRGGLD